jgi:hypothetical protein
MSNASDKNLSSHRITWYVFMTIHFVRGCGHQIDDMMCMSNIWEHAILSLIIMTILPAGIAPVLCWYDLSMFIHRITPYPAMFCNILSRGRRSCVSAFMWPSHWSQMYVVRISENTVIFSLVTCNLNKEEIKNLYILHQFCRWILCIHGRKN